MTTLQGELKAYRYTNGFSQKQMEKLLGVDGATVCSWELGGNQPHKETLTKLDVLLARKK